MSFLKRDGTLTTEYASMRKLPITPATTKVSRPAHRYRRRRAPAKSQPAEKYIDMALTALAVDDLGQVVFLGPYPQDTGENARIGKQARLRSVRIQGVFSAPLNYATVSVSVMLVYDCAPTGDNPDFQDMFQKYSPLGGYPGLCIFERQLTSQRFIHIIRWNFKLIGRTALDVTKGSFRLFDKYVDLQHLPMLFKELGTGTLLDMQRGALYLCVVSDALQTNFVLFEYAIRIKFD